MSCSRITVVAAVLAGLACAPADDSERVAHSVQGAIAAPGTGPGTTQFDVAPTGNEVRYRVREQLVRVELPNDAVGATDSVTGGIAFDDAGAVVPEESGFVIRVAGLTSDRDRRDGYVRRRLLVTDSFPTVELKPTAVTGLSWPLGATRQTFSMTGDLTVKGVTRPTTWSVTAAQTGDVVTGEAATAFTFDDFHMQQPRVPILLSVADTIRLEYDFRLVRR